MTSVITTGNTRSAKTVQMSHVFSHAHRRVNFIGSVKLAFITPATSSSKPAVVSPISVLLAFVVAAACGLPLFSLCLVFVIVFVIVIAVRLRIVFKSCAGNWLSTRPNRVMALFLISMSKISRHLRDCWCQKNCIGDSQLALRRNALEGGRLKQRAVGERLHACLPAWEWCRTPRRAPAVLPFHGES